MRRLEKAALAIPLRPGKRALVVAEQYAFKQRLRQRCAVDNDKRLVAPGTEVVYALGENLFAGACGTVYEYGGVGGRKRFARCFALTMAGLVPMMSVYLRCAEFPPLLRLRRIFRSSDNMSSTADRVATYALTLSPASWGRMLTFRETPISSIIVSTASFVSAPFAVS